MIKIVAKGKVKANEVEHFKSMAKELVEKSRQEEGNISYALNELIGEPATLAFIEFWKDQAAIDHHKATEHYTTILPKLGELCEGAFEIALFKELEL